MLLHLLLRNPVGLEAYLPMVLAAAPTSLSAAEVPSETAARFKAGAATLPPTATTTVSLTLEPAVLLLTSQPTASMVRTARSAWALASATAVPALDGVVTRRITALLDVRLASATAISPCGKNGKTCKGSTFGDCCSQHGWCGKGDGFCRDGCQLAHCLCTGISPDSECGLRNGKTIPLGTHYTEPVLLHMILVFPAAK